MSVFDSDLIEKNLPLKGREGLIEQYVESTPCFKEESEVELDVRELRSLLSALAFSFTQGTVNNMIDGFVWYRKLREDIELLISKDEPIYKEKKGYGGDTLLLGEYKPKSLGNARSPIIVLYINNIRKATRETGISSASVLINVFAHEMYHAYFQERNLDGAYKPIPEVEEPLAEYGALLFSCAFFKENDFEILKKFVEEKDKELPHYSFGAWLFNQNDIALVNRIVDYLNTRDKSFSTLNMQLRVDYSNHIYNQNYDEAAKELSQLVNPQ